MGDTPHVQTLRTHTRMHSLVRTVYCSLFPFLFLLFYHQYSDVQRTREGRRMAVMKVYKVGAPDGMALAVDRKAERKRKKQSGKFGGESHVGCGGKGAKPAAAGGNWE